MRIFLFLALIISLGACHPQKQLNTILEDPNSGNQMLYGYCNLDGLTTAPFSDWFTPEYKGYQPDSEAIIDLQKAITKDIAITLVMASWCSDSRREVPRFYKIMNEAKVSPKKTTLINVDRQKKADGTPSDQLSIQFVPTFIVYKKGVEIGRIIETPTVSIEKDLLDILSAQ